MVSGAKEDAEKVFCPDFCALRGSDSGAGGGGAVLLLPGKTVLPSVFCFCKKQSIGCRGYTKSIANVHRVSIFLRDPSPIHQLSFVMTPVRPTRPNPSDVASKFRDLRLFCADIPLTEPGNPSGNPSDV